MALNFNYLNRDMEEMEEYFPFHTSTNRLVSQASVGWHLSHSFKVINEVCTALKRSKPENYKPVFNLPRTIIFTFGSFPRGKAKAPENTKPLGEIKLENLLQEMDFAKNNLTGFDSLERNNYFIHPYFKQLNKSQSKRLLEVHTNHHLKIIRDILKAR